MLSYGGQNLVQPSGDLLDWIEKHIDHRYIWESGSATSRFSSPGLEGIPFQAPTPPDKRLPINVLCWPRGACRFAYGHFIVHETQLAAIRPQLFLPGGGHQALPFVISDGVDSITTDLFMLPPRQLVRGESTSGAPDLWLMTLVDQRYYWWYKGASSLSTSTWSALYSSIASALGLSITADAVHASYSTPPDSFAMGYRPLPIVLDACAASCGQMIVRTLAGDVLAVNSDSSSTVYDTNVATNTRNVAGGYLGATLLDREGETPASVTVCFDRLDEEGTPYAKQTTLASLALADYTAVTGFDGTKVLFHPLRADYTAGGGTPSNQSTLDTLAARLSRDWYSFRVPKIDTQFTGVAIWNPEGHTDRIYFDHSDGITTRVISGPWLEVQQYGGGDQNLTFTDVIMNWTDVVINLDNVEFVIVDNDFTITINDGNTFYVDGPGSIIVNAPLEICGWLYWCSVDYTFPTVQVDDWALPATAVDGEAIVFRLIFSGATYTLTGMRSAHNGQVVALVNTSATATLDVLHEDTNSTSGYRFHLEYDEDVRIGPRGMRLFWYDGTINRWRSMNAPGLALEDDDGSPRYTGIHTIQFDQDDGFALSNPSTGVVKVDYTPPTPTITVQDDSASPSYTGIHTLQFDQDDGFSISNPSSGVAKIDFTGGGGGGTELGWATQDDVEEGSGIDLTSGAPGASHTVETLTIPEAGTYLVLACGWGNLSTDIGNGSYLFVDMFSDDDPSTGESQKFCYNYDAEGDAAQNVDTFSMHFIYEASSSDTITLEATAAIQESATAGTATIERARLSYVRLDF